MLNTVADASSRRGGENKSSNLIVSSLVVSLLARAAIGIPLRMIRKVTAAGGGGGGFGSGSRSHGGQWLQKQ